MTSEGRWFIYCRCWLRLRYRMKYGQFANIPLKKENISLFALFQLKEHRSSWERAGLFKAHTDRNPKLFSYMRKTLRWNKRFRQNIEAHWVNHIKTGIQIWGFYTNVQRSLMGYEYIRVGSMHTSSVWNGPYLMSPYVPHPNVPLCAPP